MSLDIVVNFIPQNHNQENAKNLIVKEIIDFEIDYEYRSNTKSSEYKKLNSEDTYSYIKGSKNNQFILMPFKYQQKSKKNMVKLPELSANSVSTQIFEIVLEPRGWIKETKDTHNLYFKDGIIFKPKDVIPFILKILETDITLLKKLPKGSPFKKYFNPSYKPSDNDWKKCDGYYDFCVKENIKLEHQQNIISKLRTIRNNPDSIVQKGYNEINIDIYNYFIILDRENYIPPNENEEIMLNNITQKIEYVNKQDITEKICSKCKLFYPISNFNAHGCYCKDCEGIVSFNRRNNNFRGKFLDMYSDIRNDKRFDYTDYTEKEPIITFEEFCMQFIIQGGVSYYSGKPFIYETNNPRNISKERIQSTRGYTKENLCFVEVIFNISPGKIIDSDWSLEKIIKFKEELEIEKNNKFDLDGFNLIIGETLKNKQGVQPGILTTEQLKIKNSLSDDEWKKYYHNEYMKRYYKSDLKGFINTRIRAHKRFDKETFGMEGDIDLPFILNLIKKTECRCSISNKIMNLNNENTNFKMSIERLDNAIPHNKNNIILVCKEFNLYNSLHWNKELFKELFI
jgi:hypothetical protein